MLLRWIHNNQEHLFKHRVPSKMSRILLDNKLTQFKNFHIPNLQERHYKEVVIHSLL